MNQFHLMNLVMIFFGGGAAITDEQLPEMDLPSLNSLWGTSGLFFSGSIRDLVRFIRQAVINGDVGVSHDLMFEFGNTNQSVVVVFNNHSLQMLCRALSYWRLSGDVTLKWLK
jgi:hypothetical protein